LKAGQQGSPAASLGARLSSMLAAQALACLVLVSLAVYFVSAGNMERRQGDTLVQKQSIINHLLDEAAASGDMPALRHKLDDFFLGHTDLRLSLTGPAGSELYRNRFQDPQPVHVRRADYTARQVLAAGQVLEISVKLELDVSADYRFLKQLAWALGLAALLGALLISAGGFLLVRAGLAPVRSLVRQTDSLGAANLGKLLDGSRQPRELQPLVERFNSLLSRLRQAYEQLEAFNADVAHELCTPLATLITGTEVVLRKPHAPEALREVLESNLEDLQRLSGIVADMLFLSRADRGAVGRMEVVPSLAALAAEVGEYHEAALAESNLRIEVVGDASGSWDGALLKRAISNLLANGTRYARQGSSLQVRIERMHNDAVRVSVVNKGPAIPEEHLGRLFDRFYRADGARSGSDANHGLGLAIVAGISRMHRGNTFAHSAEGFTHVGFELPALAAGT
jgi:two-component system, OmpR family, heavy metal sensor histidine kinase CusS